MATTKVTSGNGKRRDVAKANGEMDERIKRVLVEMEKHLDSEL